MEDYKKSLKKRKMLYLIFGIILLPVVIATMYLFVKMDPILKGSFVKAFFGGVLNGMRGGFGIGALIYLLIRALQYHQTLKNDSKIKELYIEEHDERTIALNQISSRITFNIAMYVLLVMCVITAFINSTVSLTLMAVLTFVILTKLLVYGKYSRKI